MARVTRWKGSCGRAAGGDSGSAAGFSDDTLAYVTELLDPACARAAVATAVQHTKRHKAFDDVWLIGVVFDGTTVARCPTAACQFCHPIIVPHAGPPPDAGASPGTETRPALGSVIGQQHKVSVISVVGGAWALPLDVEPYDPADGELAASLRLLDRSGAALGRCFAQYVVADSPCANARFLYAVGDRGLRAIVWLKGNLPTPFAAAQTRFRDQPPTLVLEDTDAPRPAPVRAPGVEGGWRTYTTPLWEWTAGSLTAGSLLDGRLPATADVQPLARLQSGGSALSCRYRRVSVPG